MLPTLCILSHVIGQLKKTNKNNLIMVPRFKLTGGITTLCALTCLLSFEGGGGGGREGERGRRGREGGTAQIGYISTFQPTSKENSLGRKLRILL